MRIEPVLDPRVADLLEAELPDYGALHRDGDLAVTGYEGDEPVALISGRMLLDVDGHALIEHILVRPAFQGAFRSLALYRAWERLAWARGARRILGGLDVAKPFMHGVARRTGWSRYHADQQYEWYVRDLTPPREPRQAMPAAGG